MSQEKKEAIKEKLTAVREETVRVLEGFTEEQWNAPVYSDEGAEWRVIDVVRHVADSERGMTALMAQFQAGGEGVPADFDLQRWNRRVVAKLQDKGPVSYTHLDVYKRQPRRLSASLSLSLFPPCSSCPQSGTPHPLCYTPRHVRSGHRRAAAGV